MIARRNFLKTTGLVMAGLALPPLSYGMKQHLESTPYLESIGVQLWTVRDQLAADPKGTLKAIADRGYWQVELMDTLQIPDLVPIARDLGLSVKSSFINWTLLTGRWDLRDIPKPGYDFSLVVDQAAASGLDHLVFGYLMPAERTSLEDYIIISDRLNQAQEVAAAAGIQLCYHNHSFEFLPLEGSTGYQVLMDRLDPAGVKFELDVFWASLAGVDPVKLMQTLGNRVGLLHLKDKMKDVEVIYDEAKAPQEAFKELGMGVVDLKAILKEALNSQVRYCMVEQDYSSDPLKSLEISMHWLNQL